MNDRVERFSFNIGKVNLLVQLLVYLSNDSAVPEIERQKSRKTEK